MKSKRAVVATPVLPLVSARIQLTEVFCQDKVGGVVSGARAGSQGAGCYIVSNRGVLLLSSE